MPLVTSICSELGYRGVPSGDPRGFYRGLADGSFDHILVQVVFLKLFIENLEMLVRDDDKVRFTTSICSQMGYRGVPRGALNQIFAF